MKAEIFLVWIMQIKKNLVKVVGFLTSQIKIMRRAKDFLEMCFRIYKGVMLRKLIWIFSLKMISKKRSQIQITSLQ